MFLVFVDSVFLGNCRLMYFHYITYKNYTKKRPSEEDGLENRL